MNCRYCSKKLIHKFLDLGFSPPSNSYLDYSDLSKPEKYYPLRVLVCDGCWLVQTEDFADEKELFASDYAYFSSTSKSWIEHAAQYCDAMIKGYQLGKDSMVVEIASNDGYLLKNFVKLGIPCLGIEPTINTANAAIALGVPVLKKFFNTEIASELVDSGRLADLVIGNNVYAHVPKIKDFTAGIKKILKPKGIVTLEFPHLMELIRGKQFDTIYHEHFSYLSLSVVQKIFISSGLRLFNVEKISTHGGSLRVYGCHDSAEHETHEALRALLDEERIFGLERLATYASFQEGVDHIKLNFLEFLINIKKSNKKIAAYGAAAKGSTLLNYCGVKSDLLPVVYDAAASKQGKFLPGSHIEIRNPAEIDSANLDYLLILPWNLVQEVKKQFSINPCLSFELVTAIPEIAYI